MGATQSKVIKKERTKLDLENDRRRLENEDAEKKMRIEIEDRERKNKIDNEDKERKSKIDNEDKERKVRLEHEDKERKMKLEIDHKEREMKLENEEKQWQMNFENQKEKWRMDFENERKEKEIKLENERLKMKLENEHEKSKRHYELEQRKADLEHQKNEMAHQHKLAELITQMKQSKLQSGKEFLLSYMTTVTTIIQQNDKIFQNVEILSNQLKDERLPESTRKTFEQSIQKVLQGYMDTRELLDYSKGLITELKLNYDKEFVEMLGTVVKKGLITEDDKGYLLGDKPNTEVKITILDEKSNTEDDLLNDKSNIEHDLLDERSNAEE